MSEALRSGETLLAPSVGTWRPAVGVGAPLREGVLLGHLEQLGRLRAVFAPAGGSECVARVAPSGTWLAYGDVLVWTGEGVALVGSEADGAEQVADGVAGAIAVRAETDGTVYLRPEPSAAAFAEVGARVDAQSTVALVEVMKTFTAVRAPRAGEIVRVDVRDGQPIEAGAPIMWLRTR